VGFKSSAFRSFLMRAFIQYKKITSDRKVPFGPGAYSAEDWYLQMGWECVPFENIEEITKDLSYTDPVVGSINNVLLALDHLNVHRPDALEIPGSLYPFVHRKLWHTTLGEAKQNEENWPVFIKPLKQHKLFTGHVLGVFTDLYKSMAIDESTEILASEPVKFTSEYRCFVLNSQILDVRRYTGSLEWYPDISLVREMISCFKEAPVAYSIDVGSVDGKTVLVECNDAYALGSYGLAGHLQTKMITARWLEMCAKANRKALPL
jgi:hypothetical protein